MKATWLHGCISHRLSGISDSLLRDHELRWISGVKVFLRRAQGQPRPNLVRVSPPRHVFCRPFYRADLQSGPNKAPPNLVSWNQTPRIGMTSPHSPPRCVALASAASLVTRGNAAGNPAPICSGEAALARQACSLDEMSCLRVVCFSLVVSYPVPLLGLNPALGTSSVSARELLGPWSGFIPVDFRRLRGLRFDTSTRYWQTECQRTMSSSDD